MLVEQTTSTPMKKALFIFLLGAAAGAYGFYYLQEKRQNADTTKPSETKSADKFSPSPTTPTLAERAREDAESVKNTVANKLTAWHLTPDEIGAELARTGQIVRTKAQATGETIASATANARIVTVIKTKFALDKELSSRAISIACESGQVTLVGNVANTTLIAKAVGIALDTDGVTHVTAKLVVIPEKS